MVHQKFDLRKLILKLYLYKNHKRYRNFKKDHGKDENLAKEYETLK